MVVLPQGGLEIPCEYNSLASYPPTLILVSVTRISGLVETNNKYATFQQHSAAFIRQMIQK